MIDTPWGGERGYLCSSVAIWDWGQDALSLLDDYASTGARRLFDFYFDRAYVLHAGQVAAGGFEISGVVVASLGQIQKAEHAFIGLTLATLACTTLCMLCTACDDYSTTHTTCATIVHARATARMCTPGLRFSFTWDSTI